MGTNIEGSNIVLTNSIAGSLFPKGEKEIIFPVLIDGTKTNGELKIDGSVYGKSIQIIGSVRVNGPVLSRGDTTLTPGESLIRLYGGITVNGLLKSEINSSSNKVSLLDSLENTQIIIRGDVVVSKSLFLQNTIIFGNVRAVNCKLVNCIVLGTIVVKESLSVSMSSIGGYSSRDVIFEGSCLLIHALGESKNTPKFLPYETLNGEIIPSDIRYYPALRKNSRLANLAHKGIIYPEYSALDMYSDWVTVNAKPNIIDNDQSTEELSRTVLSIGGRIGDFSGINESIEAITSMLKCGFEYDHLTFGSKEQFKSNVSSRLNSDELWILNQVCQ